MRLSIILAMLCLAVNAFGTQVVYSVSTNKSVYDYADTIYVTIKVVNNKDVPDTMRFGDGCQANFFIDTLDWMVEGHIACTQLIVDRIIAPHDSIEYGGSYWHLHSFTGERLGAGRHGVVGTIYDELNLWSSDTVWINVIGPTESTDLPSLPSGYALRDNFPNPFNPSTILSYALPVESKIRITVINPLGQVVATLADRTEPAGEGSIRWAADGLAGGVYFCRFEAVSTANPPRSYIQVTKMMLLR